MKFFVDTAELADIRELADQGLVDGVTTNPSLVMKTGRRFLDLVAEVCDIVDGPVSAEVAATDFETMLAEGRRLTEISPKIAVKVPLTQAGLKVCKALSSDGHMVNVTLCFSAGQAILAAKAGATFVSPFVGRLDDISEDGMQLIADIRQIYNQYPDFKTQILVASMRHPMHVVTAAKIGAHVATMPPGVMRQLFHHPLTEIGLARFLTDWQKTGQSILEQR